MSQLPRLLYPTSSCTVPLVKSRRLSPPTSDIRRFASGSAIRRMRDREIAVLLRQGRKKLPPSLKILFSDEPMQIEHSVSALTLVFRRPFCHTSSVSKLLRPLISARTLLLNGGKRKLTPLPVSGRGMSLSRDEQIFLAQPRSSLLNTLEGPNKVALVSERRTDKIEAAINLGFLDKLGFTGEMRVDRLPFDIPTEFHLHAAQKLAGNF
eukprot:gb/GEZJ01001749.1/.p1 GENE.gb/GEZJ01001749.1/~~gb/GEZJ01001749.1/.p1  ORF type:complete len:209 (-),score=24.14 gb/GEZJ01001749.1/:390-1016(-)